MAAGAGDPFATRLGRRLVTIPAYAGAFVVLVAVLPILLPALAVADLVRGTRLATTRLALFGVVFLAAEMAGLVACLVGSLVTAGSPARSVAWHRALQTAWARALLAAAKTLFDFRIEIEGDDAVPAGPVLVLARHVSIADTLLPSVLLTHRHGLALRFVLKRELLSDPCLDVVGHRLPNVFVRRGSRDSAGEIARVRELAAGIGRGEGVLIYPEGTRFTPAKRARSLERMAANDPERHARVRGLARVLPPELGGTLALLDACPDADVLFLAHTGFEGATTLREVTSGALVGRRVRVAFRCVATADVPRASDERARWLDAAWARVDAWVAGMEAPSAARPLVAGQSW